MRIYNLFPLLAGTFSYWPSHVERAAEMGFDWIFVNPVQKPGMSGSLYSIADYFELNPRLVDPTASLQEPEKQLRNVIEYAQAKGLRVMVDLVINHCAVDSHLIGEHPAWFVRDANGRVDHPFCIENGKKVVWGDLARFDHRGTSDPDGLYRYFHDIVTYLIDLGFSGFRCDAAYQIPGNLWQRLIMEVKSQYPHVMFLAETLGCTPDQTRKTARAGFDYVFNSSKWWDFSNPWLLEQYNLLRETTRSISFPESHDTERLFHEMYGNVAAMKQRYLFSALFSAGVMMPMGFEFGFKKRMHVVNTRPEDWEVPAVDLRDFIHDVNVIKAQFSIFQQECPTKVIPYENPSILVLWKASLETPEEALIVLNKDPWHHQHFYVERLDAYVQAGAPLVDHSPEFRLDYLPTPFDYDLRPGQVFVFVTQRDTEEE
jgi:starch synthase (maltosyl-transferring)